MAVMAQTMFRYALLCLSALAIHLSINVRHALATPLFSPAYHPIVIWHGLGDSAYSEPMKQLADELRQAYPGIYVRLISLADDLSADQRAGFFGNVNAQVEQVCDALANDKQLSDGFDAIGFSQGGQFMRAYVQRCNRPAVRNLITFGSQHLGISDLPACKPTELLCRLAEGALRGGIYTEYAQSNIVTAQYYRDPNSADRYEKYLQTNKFLTDINNELSQNDTYKENLKKLDNMVLLMFDHDATVQPKQSAWFASYPVATPDEFNDKIQSSEEREVLPLRQTELYTSDLLGLRVLDKRGALIMDACKGGHMHIDAACSMKVFGRYAGIAPPSKLLPASVRHAWSGIVYALTGVRTASVPAGIQLMVIVVGSSIFLSLVMHGAMAMKDMRRQGRVRLQ